MGISRANELDKPELSKQLLIAGAHDLGIDLNGEQAEQFLLYLSDLLKWNRKINLTAITDEREVIKKHFLDSLTYYRGFSPKSGLQLLDLGSGAGFPALPIKIAVPEISITMVESVKKKSSFLRHIVRYLRLTGVEILEKRAEELTDLYVERYDVITARAFASLKLVMKAGVRFLKPGGLMILSRGPEETVSDDVIASFGLALESRAEITLPFSDYRRSIWVLRKNPNVPRGTIISGSTETEER